MKDVERATCTFAFPGARGEAKVVLYSSQDARNQGICLEIV